MNQPAATCAFCKNRPMRGMRTCFVHQDQEAAADDYVHTDEDAPSNVRAIRGGPVPVPVSTLVPLEPEHIEPEWETWWLPAPVRDWVEAAATFYRVPRVIPIAAALTSAACLLQGKVSVRLKPGWEEPLTLWWLVSADTGARKSGVLKASQRAIRALQQQMHETCEEQARTKRWRLEHAKAQAGALKRAVKWADRREQKTADATNFDWKASNEDETPAEQLREVEAEISRLEGKRTRLREPGIPSAPTWLHDDFNPSSLEGLLMQNYEAEGYARLMVAEAEGTWIQNAIGRHTGSVSVESYLKAYSGEPITKTRRAPNGPELLTSRIEAAYLSLLCMVQPTVLQEFTSADRLASNGFLGRCIISRAERKMGLPDYDAPPIPDAIQSAYDAWLTSMHAVTPGYVDLSILMAPGEPLRGLYEQVSTAIQAEDAAAVGWSVRAVPRIAKVLAILYLSGELSLLSGQQAMLSGVLSGEKDEEYQGDSLLSGAVRERPHGQGGCVSHEDRSKVNILVSLLYSRTLSPARAIEPVADTLPTLSRRALGVMLRLTAGQQRSEFTNRELSRALECKKDDLTAALTALVESGHVLTAGEVRQKGGMTTYRWKLTPAALTAANATAKPASNPTVIGDDIT